MKSAVALIVASAAVTRAFIQQCNGSPVLENGNYYCGAVKHILMQNVGHQGSYKEVTGMDDDGTCHWKDTTNDNPISPWNEPFTIAMRGPLKLYEFATYTLGGSAKRDVSGSHAHARAHAHARRHAHHAAHQKRADDDMVTAVIDGTLVSWKNDYKPTPAPEAKSADAAAPAAPAAPASASQASSDDKTASKSAVKSDKPSPPPVDGSDWVRTSYYNAQSATCDGLTFLGNYGGQGSGKFDTTWGLSLAYLNAEGNAGAAEPNCLKDALIPSNREFTIWSDQPCDDSCGFSRAPDVAYKGFDGDKIVIVKFTMPLDDSNGGGGNDNMPAIWALNAKIPRTGQYHECSCWKPGCGECDIFEVLSPGCLKAKATLHSNKPGGSSDYFERPVDAPITVATVVDSASNSISIKIVPDDTDFSAGLSRDLVQSWIDIEPSAGALSSLFQLSD